MVGYRMIIRPQDNESLLEKTFTYANEWCMLEDAHQLEDIGYKVSRSLFFRDKHPYFRIRVIGYIGMKGDKYEHSNVYLNNC